MIIVVLGVPGSGKGTQSRRIAKKLGFNQFSTGEILRNEAKAHTPLGKKTKNIIDTGKLVSDKIMIQIVEKYLFDSETSSNENGIVFDGFPRTLKQAEFLDSLLVTIKKKINHVFELIVDDDAIIERISGRYSCGNCGAEYHDIFYKPQVPGICDACAGNHFVRREDDNEHTVRGRLNEYYKYTSPITAYYSERGTLHRIDGMQSVQHITNSITDILDKNGE